MSKSPSSESSSLSEDELSDRSHSPKLYFHWGKFHTELSPGFPSQSVGIDPFILIKSFTKSSFLLLSVNSELQSPKSL